jgi:luciferase family oxidoreductase group 1
VVELQARLRGYPPLPVAATPGTGSNVEMWILGSSTFGAQLAAMLGLPYAFASHFAPAQLDAALKVYRERFEPSEELAKPHVMAAMTAVCAETDDEAQYLASSIDQSFVALRTGKSGRMKPPIANYRESLPREALAMLEHMDQARAVGSPATVRAAVHKFIERTRADEIIIAGATYDPAARRRSLQLTMDAVR